ncbi:hypothetical protein HMF8227_01437 [Saliniradius amylolyticus]|uniref:HTH cro/C1-type domain-containing protein n=2 Tax=Saliniradius amylolyticus TaxID=2183582 RepID=A0A2S2E320_9ALTE|nr:hypothetical protein HMF8227_01437 [Saliniradius amylolyticus]
MFTTCELLDRVKATYDLRSDYAVAKKIGVRTSSMTRYRKHGGTLDDSVAVEVAELLELDPFQVLVSVHLERAHNQHNQKLVNVWQQYAA